MAPHHISHDISVVIAGMFNSHLPYPASSIVLGASYSTVGKTRDDPDATYLSPLGRPPSLIESDQCLILTFQRQPDQPTLAHLAKLTTCISTFYSLDRKQ
jgi:hypothetical protein